MTRGTLRHPARTPACLTYPGGPNTPRLETGKEQLRRMRALEKMGIAKSLRCPPKQARKDWKWPREIRRLSAGSQRRRRRKPYRMAPTGEGETMPKSVALFEKAGYLAVLLGIASGFINYPVAMKVPGATLGMFVTTFVISISLEVLLIWLIARKRKNWARWVWISAVRRSPSASIRRYWTSSRPIRRTSCTTTPPRGRSGRSSSGTRTSSPGPSGSGTRRSTPARRCGPALRRTSPTRSTPSSTGT